jgi:Na+-driven multidrug efflux pump
MLARLDLAGLAALNLAMRLEFMVIVPLVGLSNALAPFMGFNLGRNDVARIRQGARASLGLGWLIIVPVMGLFLFCGRPSTLSDSIRSGPAACCN